AKALLPAVDHSSASPKKFWLTWLSRQSPGSPPGEELILEYMDACQTLCPKDVQIPGARKPPASYHPWPHRETARLAPAQPHHAALSGPKRSRLQDIGLHRLN